MRSAYYLFVGQLLNSLALLTSGAPHLTDTAHPGNLYPCIMSYQQPEMGYIGKVFVKKLINVFQNIMKINRCCTRMVGLRGLMKHVCRV